MAEVPSLGARGGGWVVLQFALIAAIVAAVMIGPPWPVSVRSALSVTGALLAVAGGVLAAVSARTLGRSLTPFPRPTRGAARVEHGPYRLVRHPIYTGGMLFFAGLSLAFSPAGLILTTVLAVVWALKAQVEERFLRAADPAYGEYCARTRFRLVPFVY